MTAEIPTHPQIAVSAAIFRDGKLLLVRRARSPGKGFWSLPGGRVEFGESLETALKREVMEETSLVIDVAGLAGWREVLPRGGVGGHYVILPFATRWHSGEAVLNDELDDFRWIAPEETFAGLQLTEGLPGIIQAARSVLGA